MLLRSLRTSSLIQGVRFATNVATKAPTSVQQGVDIFLGNLEASLTSISLKDIISKKFNEEFNGPRIVFNREEKRSLGYGYITVSSMEIANRALEALKGLEISGKQVKIDIAQERRILRAVYIGNLAPDVTEADIIQLVQEKFGKDSVVKVRLPVEEGKAKGFAHIEFNTSGQRDQAISELNGVELKGRPIKVDKAVMKSKLPVVCINNISYDVTKQHLEEMFDELVGRGNYSDVRLHYDKVTGYPRGFAHVTFTSKRIAMNALNELKGIEMMGRPLRANIVDKDKDKLGSKIREPRNKDQSSATTTTSAPTTPAFAPAAEAVQQA